MGTETQAWSVDQDSTGGWVFTYICYESDASYPTREMAMAALIDTLIADNQRLMIDADDD